MSLAGQWIMPYAGSNTGNLVIELDRVDGHFEGIALIWDQAPDHLHAMVRITTKDAGSAHQLNKLPVIIINNIGDFVQADALLRLKETRGIIYPATVNATLKLLHGALHVTWTASHGGVGSGCGPVSKTRLGQRSEIKINPASTWSEFKEVVNQLDPGRYAFRGQESAEWRLRSTFHRAGRANMERYAIEDIAELQRIFSAVSNHVFNLNDPLHYAAFLHSAQHHGYPTPLLDWSTSPYVAAFFAFQNIEKHPKKRDRRRVRIIKFHSTAWNMDYRRADKLFPIWPNVTVLSPLAFGNPRAIPQQAISTVSNVDDIEGHIQEREKISGKTYLEAFDLSRSERDDVMRELALMGVTAGSLFPGLDGACKALKESRFG